ncbi:FAD dependent oxidoreductase [Aspergillus sclerotialis]|uniref:FAD dependent oxidoreductase n=1 Tax=Aspergillus sclerotialis TaxID=2070753 RepID=A0A3A2ZWH6_9EURO|nr:FAD dependent oxidoreductase [Aspergillus sclerotialis]
MGIFTKIHKTKTTIKALATDIRSTNADIKALQNRINSPCPPVSNPTVSYWQSEAPYPDLVDIQSETLADEADIVIIGSGIAGCSVAYTLLNTASSSPNARQQENHPPRIVLLEARTLCSGATGRNGGQIKCTPHTEYSGYKRRFGKESAKKLVDFQKRHLGIITNVAEAVEDGGLSEVREVETVDVFTDEDAWKKAVACVDEARKDVHEFVEGKYKIEPSHCYGIIAYRAGAVWPYRLVTGIYKSLLDKYSSQFSIETNTRVTEIRNDPKSQTKPFLVATARGTIRASHVIHCTDGFASTLIPGLRGKLFPVRGHMTAQNAGTQVPDTKGRRSWSVVGKRGFDYITQRPSPSHELPGELLVGGGVVQSPGHGIDEFGIWREDGISYTVRSYLGGLMPTIFGSENWGEDTRGYRVQQTWTGCMGFTCDLLPYVGRLDQKLTGRKLPRRSRRGAGEWICAGFQGEGMVLAWLSGIAIGLMVNGVEDEEVEAQPGIPGGKVKDWLPSELRCSKERVERATVTELGLLL